MRAIIGEMVYEGVIANLYRTPISRLDIIQPHPSPQSLRHFEQAGENVEVTVCDDQGAPLWIVQGRTEGFSIRHSDIYEEAASPRLLERLSVSVEAIDWVGEAASEQ